MDFMLVFNYRKWDLMFTTCLATIKCLKPHHLFVPLSNMFSKPFAKFGTNVKHQMDTWTHGYKCCLVIPSCKFMNPLVITNSYNTFIFERGWFMHEPKAWVWGIELNMDEHVHIWMYDQILGWNSFIYIKCNGNWYSNIESIYIQGF